MLTKTFMFCLQSRDTFRHCRHILLTIRLCSAEYQAAADNGDRR